MVNVMKQVSSYMSMGLSSLGIATSKTEAIKKVVRLPLFPSFSHSWFLVSVTRQTASEVSKDAADPLDSRGFSELRFGLLIQFLLRK